MATILAGFGTEVKCIIWSQPMTPFSLFGYDGDALPLPGLRGKRAALLTIDADLSAPPSAPSVFRDTTLVASIRGYRVVAVAPQDALDGYNNWFLRYGLWDYLEDLVPVGQIADREVAVEIVGGPEAKLTAHNLAEVLRHIPVRS